SLADLPAIARRNQVVSPALVIVGEVCRYSESFDWFSARPLFGRRIAVPRVKPGPSRLAGRLGELGAEVTEFQVAELRPLGGEGSPLDEAIGNIGSYSWLVFTSEFGVQVFFEEMERGDRDIRLLAALRIACVGSSTAQALRQYGIKADYVPDDYNGTALARGLTQLVKPGQRVLLARAESAADDLPEILKLAGIIVSDLPIYSREPVDLARAAVDFDFTAFTSSSAVEGFAEALGEHALAGLRAVCIGSRTAATALSLGMNVYLSEQSTIEGLVAKIKELSANGNQDKATA
ncbi:MAG: uroporphyrinogen-III synthase, partial [Coriobacteriia bacterium]|nr:uroporphyrinogen-III synthase [Coriobacteriia bacterium]